MNREIFLLAGEASGDDRGAELVGALLQQDHSLKISGMGGPRMKAAGMEVLADITGNAVVGIFEAIKRYPFFKKVFDRMMGECVARRPAAVVGIDYPGFNLRFERAARQKLGCQTAIVHYVSPQLWAWDEARKHRMAKFLDCVLCIFPFEPAVYDGTGLRAEYVGHPLANRIHPTKPGDRDLNRIALLPGSRKREISRHWPVLREVARRMRQARPSLRFVVGSPHARSFDGFEAQPVDLLMAQAGTGIVASGTATLEACLHGLPILVVYKVFGPTYWLGRTLIKVPYLAMPNVIARKPILQEFIQDRCDPALLIPALEALLDSSRAREEILTSYSGVRAQLGQEDAAANAAGRVLNLISSK